MLFRSHLHRFYLKYQEVKPKSSEENAEIIPCVASDFQDIISNPLIELTKDNVKNLNQLEILLIIDKKIDQTTIKLSYSDFRVIVSPQFIVSMMEMAAFSLSQVSKITESFSFATKTLVKVQEEQI